MKWCNFFNKISLILQALGCAVLYFVIEAICRHSFTEAWIYMTTKPLVFAYNTAFIFTTVPVKFRSALHSCQFPHPLQKVRGRSQRTDDIRPGLRIPHIQILQEASARFPGLRKHRAGRKWRWPAGSIPSYGQPSGHKIQYRKLPGKADPGFCPKLIFRFWFLRSDS